MASIQKSTDELLGVRLDLETLLGSDWKERSVYPNVESAFSADELRSVTERRKVTEETATTPTEVYAAQLNRVFQANGGVYSASVAELDGRQQAVVLGEVGGDLVYLTAQAGEVKSSPENGTVGMVGADRFAIISKDGGVFRVDRMLKNGAENTDVVFLDPQGRRTGTNFETDAFGNGGGVVTQLPYDQRGMGTVFHEVGHAVRAKHLGQNPELDKADRTALREFSRTSKTGSPLNPNNELSAYQTRQIKAQDERGAWATGVSILREVGKSTGINTGSSNAVKEALGRAEEALKTYDKVSYALSGQPEDEMIPTFSQESKRASRGLHQQKGAVGVSYGDIPSFDQDTGENIANNPARVSSIISGEGNPSAS